MNKGLEFEATLAKSWVASQINLVRQKFIDGGDQQPCDERIDFENFRVFNELKSTAGSVFNVTQIKPHQFKSLYNWHKKFKNSVGLVSVEFRKHNEAYMIDILELIKIARGNGTNIIELKDFRVAFTYKLGKKVNGIYSVKEDFLVYLKDVLQ